MKKLLLGLSTIGMFLVPVATVVSCSSSGEKTPIKNPDGIIDGSQPAPGVDQSTFDEINKHVFGVQKDEYGNYVNTFSNSLKETLKSSLETKTKDEVLKIAQDNLSKITSEELEQMLKINLAKGFQKGEFVESFDTSNPNNENNPKILRSWFGKEISDAISLLVSKSKVELNQNFIIDGTITDFSYKKKTSEISFKTKITSIAKVSLTANGKTATGMTQLYFEESFNNLKIKADVNEISGITNGEDFGRIFLPTISLDESQPNAFIEFTRHSNSIEINSLIDFMYDNFNDYMISNIKLNKEQLKKAFKFYLDKLLEVVNKVMKIKLGVVDGKFIVNKNNTTSSYDYLNYSFVQTQDPALGEYDSNWGYEMVNNQEKPLEIIVKPSAFGFKSNILFTQMNKETNKPQWQAFKQSV